MSWTSGWHTFWQASGADGVTNRWGFYVDSWSNLLGTVDAGSDNTGTHPVSVVTEGSGSGSINNVYGPVQFTFAMQYFTKDAFGNGQWSLVRHAKLFRAWGSSCPQLGLTAYSSNNVEMGQGEGCPATGSQLW